MATELGQVQKQPNFWSKVHQNTTIPLEGVAYVFVMVAKVQIKDLMKKISNASILATSKDTCIKCPITRHEFSMSE
jgi:hypothetical protein